MNLFILFKMAIKMAESVLKRRVGRVSGNTCFFRPYRYMYIWLGKFHPAGTVYTDSVSLCRFFFFFFFFFFVINLFDKK